jgi:DNA-binding MarR family transcriptional regulator
MEPIPPDLDAELRGLVGYNIKRANSAMMGDLERVLGRFGLRRTTFSALSVVAGMPGIRQSVLAAVLAIERPNLVQIVEELRWPGWVVRVRDGADRRAYLLSASEAGAVRVAVAGAALRAYDARLTAGFSAQERAALIVALRRVERNGTDAWEGFGHCEISTT